MPRKTGAYAERVRLLALIVPAALAACRPDVAAPAAPSAAATTSASAAPSASAPAPASAVPSASASASLVVLPPPAPNKTPIRDCALDAEDDALACCSEAALARVEHMARNRSPAECHAIDALPRLAACPTFFARGFHGAVEGCFRGAMERELDRRLLPLKNADPAAFHREMGIQSAFNDALRATCDGVLVKEQSTGDFRGAFRCATFSMELRTRQAVAINAGGLETTPHEPLAKPRHAGRFRAFAAGLCAASALWKAPPPSDCEQRLLGELDAALADAARF